MIFLYILLFLDGGGCKGEHNLPLHVLKGHFLSFKGKLLEEEGRRKRKTTGWQRQKNMHFDNVLGKESFEGQREWLFYFIWPDFSSATWASLVFLLTRKQLGCGRCLTDKVRVNFFHLDCIKHLPFAHLPPPKSCLLLPGLSSYADVCQACSISPTAKRQLQ